MSHLTLALDKISEIRRDGFRRPGLVLLCVGSICVTAYLFFALMPLLIPDVDFSHFPPYLALPEGDFELNNYYLLYFIVSLNALALFCLYLIALKAAGSKAAGAAGEEGRRTDSITWYVVGFTVVFHLIMLLTPYLLSTDIFDYIRHGRIFAIYGENPLIVPAIYFPDSPFFNMGGWVGTGSVYGPIHVYVTGALAWLAGDGFTANFLLFKSFFIGCNIINLALIWKIAARIRPGLEKRALVFYGWNPFILTLVVANAHNDILMLTLVLAGFYMYLDRRFLIGVVCITLATLLKFITLPILLLFVALVIRNLAGTARRLAFAAGSLAIAGSLTVISYMPMWAGRKTFDYMTAVGSKTNFTLPSLIRDMAAGHMTLSLSNMVIQLSMAVFLASYLTWHLVKIRNFRELLSASAGVAFLTPMVMFWFQPWYLTLALGLVALRPQRLLYIAALAFSFSLSFFDGFWWHAPMSVDIQKPLRVLVVFGPPVVLLLVLKAREALPGAFRRAVSWSLEANGPGRGGGAVSTPSHLWLAVEVLTLVTAAAVPMAAVISTSPQLRSIASLIAVKLRLLIPV